MNKGAVFFFTAAVAFLFLSCNKQIYYSEETEIEAGQWDIKDSMSFKIPVDNLSDNFNIYILLDVYEDFLTNNIWLFVKTESPSGNIQKDTIMYYIADEKGRWYGNKKSELIENKFLYKGNIRFPEKGDYLVILKHGMRETDIPKVSTVGLNVEYFETAE